MAASNPKRPLLCVGLMSEKRLPGNGKTPVVPGRVFRSYIICTSPRSGNTLLCKLLAATNVAGVPGSHFHVPSLEGWLAAYDLHENDFHRGTTPFGQSLRRPTHGAWAIRISSDYGYSAKASTTSCSSWNWSRMIRCVMWIELRPCSDRRSLSISRAPTGLTKRSRSFGPNRQVCGIVGQTVQSLKEARRHETRASMPMRSPPHG